MGTVRLPSKFRDAVRLLRDAGFEPTRKHGDHHFFEKDGITIVLPHRKNGLVTKGKAKQVLDAIEGRAPSFMGR